jgi:hypothetical protein
MRSSSSVENRSSGSCRSSPVTRYCRCVGSSLRSFAFKRGRRFGFLQENRPLTFPVFLSSPQTGSKVLCAFLQDPSWNAANY